MVNLKKMLMIYGVLVTIAALLFMMRAGNLNHELELLKQEYATASKAAELEAERIRAEAAEVNAETVEGWAAAVDYWRNVDDGRVRVVFPVCPDSVSAVPGAAGESVESHVSEHRLGAEVDVAECEARLNAAVLDAAWIEHVKLWVKKQANNS